GDGTLFPNSKVRFADISDGSSNTIMIGEQSDFMRDTAGNKYQPASNNAYNSGGFYGWTMGCNGDTSTPPTFENNSDNRTFNCTTVAFYQINQAGPSFGAAGTGTDSDLGNDFPFTSAHPGGAVFLFGDGTVRFLSNDTPLLTLKQLASRNDGAVVTL